MYRYGKVGPPHLYNPKMKVILNLNLPRISFQMSIILRRLGRFSKVVDVRKPKTTQMSAWAADVSPSVLRVVRVEKQNINTELATYIPSWKVN